MQDQIIITEKSLPGFRSRAMAPCAIYDYLPGDNEDASALLFNMPPGIGKSYTARGLTRHALNHHHDIIFYVAPTRALIDDFSDAFSDLDNHMLVLEPRPKRKCGGYDPEWSRLEKSGCSALAKQTLCRECLHYEGCTWPDQLSRIDQDTQLVLLTEQNLHLNPSLIKNAIRQADAVKPLIIFDEALFIGSVQNRSFTQTELKTFQNVLRRTYIQDDSARTTADGMIGFIDNLLDDDMYIEDAGRIFASGLTGGIADIQRTGIQIAPTQFRYLANDLALINSKTCAGQWRHNEKFEIVTRVETSGCDVVILAPYLQAGIVEEYLQRPVNCVYPNYEFKHTATQFINISDPCGTARSLTSKGHFNRICDFFLALTMRNILQSKRTVLVCRKRFAAKIKERFETQAKTLGVNLVCTIVSSGNKLRTTEPGEIAIINYGIVGINDLQDCDALYCVGGYYCNEGLLNDVYQQCIARGDRFELGLSFVDGRRKIVAADGDYTTRHHARLAKDAFELLERGVVLQAVGRVRPFTSPAQVILFQCDNLSEELSGLTTHATLADARDNYHIPTLKQMNKSYLGERVRSLLNDGLSLRVSAKELECAPSTASLAAKAPSFTDLLNNINLGELNA